MVSVDDVVEVFWFDLQFVVEVERGFRGDSSAEVGHGPHGGVEVHLAPLGDYLETINSRAIDSFFKLLGMASPGPSVVFVDDDGMICRKKLGIYIYCDVSYVG